ncbi:hypothetical protein GCM10023144_01540 [Pigmentiphaga soli]|uniref:Uncharacterized protein n=1 Tax=Pigmentiphaga soli TaxID=1007095 RepID=A0ABP8GDF4_9BURK
MDYPDELKIQMDALAAQRRATALKRTYRITDTGRDFFRQATIHAADRDAAQAEYIDAMERAGLPHGDLTVHRVSAPMEAA